MKVTQYPTLEEALYLHKQLLKRFGGAKGIRDLGLLESALFRPQTGHYTSLSLEAAALMQSLSQNHPFVDGNKRVAFALTAVFFHLNGYRMIVEADEAEHFLITRVIKAHAPINEIAQWLESTLRPIK